MKRRLLALILMLCAVLVLLPTAVMAVDIEYVKYKNVPYRYNPMTQAYDSIGDPEALALRRALIDLEFPYRENAIKTYPAENPYTLCVPYELFPDGTSGVTKDADGRTVVEYTDDGVTYKLSLIHIFLGLGCTKSRFDYSNLTCPPCFAAAQS